jgi:hypothetical protein
LATTFAVDVDFSFAAKLPTLQTLSILNVEEKHDLKPLEKLPHLQCLALSRHPVGDDKGDRFAAKTFKNVQAFEEARPDVAVVEYRGLCLGSFWLLPVAAAAAVVAWLIRRHWVGKRVGVLAIEAASERVDESWLGCHSLTAVSVACSLFRNHHP